MKILLILNDQGGGVIQWDEKEVSPTLRQQMKHHEPVVVVENESNDIKPMGCAEQAHSHG